MMKIHTLSFGSINIDGQDYVKDIVIHKGNIEKRKKKKSKRYQSHPASDLLIYFQTKMLIFGSTSFMNCNSVLPDKFSASQSNIILTIRY